MISNKDEPGTSSALLAGLEPHPKFRGRSFTPQPVPESFVPERLRSWLPNLTRRQWLFIGVFAVADLIAGIVYNIKGPFYPSEAEKKGVSSTQYGFVFGIFDLTKIFVCPIVGKYVNNLTSARRVFITAMMIIGVCSVCFGLLDKINNPTAFLTLSLVIRVCEAIGSGGFSVASFSIISCEFPDNVATTFASLETMFGIGLIVGPLFGGLLFQMGGYPIPFIVTGFALFFLALLIMSVMPQPEISVLDQEPKKEGFSGFSVLKIPGVLLATFGVFTAASSTGFVNATLEPHIRQFNLTPVEVGVVFIIYGSVYALTAPIFGRICDHVSQPNLITLCGAGFNFLAFLLLGPAPFFQLNSILWVTCVGLILHGLALGATFVSGFVLSLRYSVANGFPDNMATYGVVSGMWTSILSLGICCGSSIGGILLDNVGFRWGSLYVLISMIILSVLIIMFLLKNGVHITKSGASVGSEYQALITPVTNSGSPTTSTTLTSSSSKQPSYGIA